MVGFTIMAGLLTAVAVQQTDTVVAVDPGARLVIESFRGEVTIETWDRDEMRVAGDHSRRTFVEIDQSRSAVRLRADAWGGPAQVDYELTIPASMDIEIRGTFVSADIDGVEGEVRVFTTNGDITVRGGRGFVTLSVRSRLGSSHGGLRGWGVDRGVSAGVFAP